MTRHWITSAWEPAITAATDPVIRVPLYMEPPTQEDIQAALEPLGIKLTNFELRFESPLRSQYSIGDYSPALTEGPMTTTVNLSGVVYNPPTPAKPQAEKRKMQLFNGTVILNPTKNQEEDGVEAEVIAQRDRFMAPNSTVAVLIMGGEIAEDKRKNWSRMEVQVSPS